MNTFSALFLGTGTSVGVPVIGCKCKVCTSKNPKNNRLRSSIVFKSKNTTLLIDSGPDLRQQALRSNLTHIDAVLYTHCHLDHVAGFDELRAFCWNREDELPLFGNPETLAALERMHPWAFNSSVTHRGYIRPSKRPISKQFKIGDFNITSLAVEHGTVETHGYLLELPDSKKVAYISDLKSVKEESIEDLQNVDCLIIDGLRYADQPHPTHMSVEEACALGEKVSAKQVILTHLSHEVEHEEVNERTAAHISPAYDGLELNF